MAFHIYCAVKNGAYFQIASVESEGKGRMGWKEVEKFVLGLEEKTIFGMSAQSLRNRGRGSKKYGDG